MSDKTYNGWTNYETWNLALWLDNDQGSYEHWRERAEEVYRDTDGDDRRDDAYTALAKELEADIKESQPTVTGFRADMLNAALSEIDYREIAEHYIDDVADDIDAEERAQEEANRESMASDD